MSVATVYNNLRVFRESGLVKELTYGDASSRFDFVTSDHYHAICENCGKIVDFHYPGLDEVEQLAAHVINIQFVLSQGEVYVLEVNPRSSRTVPFLSKITGIPMANLATKIILGQKLAAFGYTEAFSLNSKVYL